MKITPVFISLIAMSKTQSSGKMATNAHGRKVYHHKKFSLREKNNKGDGLYLPKRNNKRRKPV